MSLFTNEDVNQDETENGTQKLEGSLRYFDHVRGYGFIKSNDGSGDILLPMEVIKDFDDTINLRPGDTVSCEIMKSSKGMLATRITDVLKGAAGVANDLLTENNMAPRVMDVSKIKEEDLETVIVKWYDDRKGYGFAVSYGDYGDIMLSRQVLRDCGIRTIFPGDKLNITILETDKGYLANYVEYS